MVWLEFVVGAAVMRGAAVGLCALAASVLINAALGWAWLSGRDAVVTARSERNAAQAMAQECSDATVALRKLADQRTREADKARAQARKAAAAHSQRADDILAALPAVPGDDCASARVRADGWIKGRTAP